MEILKKNQNENLKKLFFYEKKFLEVKEKEISKREKIKDFEDDIKIIKFDQEHQNFSILNKDKEIYDLREILKEKEKMLIFYKKKYEGNLEANFLKVEEIFGDFKNFGIFDNFEKKSLNLRNENFLLQKKILYLEKFDKKNFLEKKEDFYVEDFLKVFLEENDKIFGNIFFGLEKNLEEQNKFIKNRNLEKEDEIENLKKKNLEIFENLKIEMKNLEILKKENFKLKEENFEILKKKKNLEKENLEILEELKFLKKEKKENLKKNKKNQKIENLEISEKEKILKKEKNIKKSKIEKNLKTIKKSKLKKIEKKEKKKNKLCSYCGCAMRNKDKTIEFNICKDIYHYKCFPENSDYCLFC